MTNLRGPLLRLILASLVCFPSAAWADPEPECTVPIGGAPVYFVSGAPAPKSPHDTIRMDSGQVIFRLRKTSYMLDAVFRFFNTGTTTTEWVGIPYRGWGYDTGISGRAAFLLFDAWVEGRKIAFSHQRDRLGSGTLFPERLPHDSQSKLTFTWMVSKITFPGHARTTIRVRYEAPYERYEAANCAHLRWAHYLYGSASLWKGDIGKASFIIDCTEVGGTKNISVRGFKARPGPKLIADNLWTLAMTDFEPDVGAKLILTYSDKSPQQTDLTVRDEPTKASIYR